MKIPKIAHRIWFGDPFPDKYKAYLCTLSQLNPDYQIKLWSDPETVSVESYIQLKTFCTTNNIVLCNIREHMTLTNFDLITQELNASNKTETHKKLHYVRASDIARIAILLAEGGIYMDTDSEPLYAFPEFNAVYGVLLKWFGDRGKNIGINYFNVQEQHYNFDYYFSNIFYDFIASVPHHKLLTTAAKITCQDYKTYQTSASKAWESCDDPQLLLYGTIKLTGTALKWALNHLYQTEQFSIDNAGALFFICDNIMKAYYDKSYLEGFTGKALLVVKMQLYEFLAEIENKRQKKFKVIECKESFLKPNSDDILELKLKETRQKDEISEWLHEKNKRKEAPSALTITPEINWPTLFIQRSELEVRTPKFHIDLSQIKFQPPITRKQIYDTYRKNGGGAFAMFKLFTCKPDRTPEELIKVLQARAGANTKVDSASKMTLNELNINTPVLYK